MKIYNLNKVMKISNKNGFPKFFGKNCGLDKNNLFYFKLLDNHFFIVKCYYQELYLNMRRIIARQSRMGTIGRYERFRHIERVTPLINSLKKLRKFTQIKKQFFNYCRIFFRYTGSNIFGTITNNKGAVYFQYSSGHFKGLRTRKEKTTVFVAQQLGQLICLRLYRSNAKNVNFVPLLNHRKARILIRFMGFGFRLIRFFKIRFVFLKRKVMRNGVRLKKIPRK